MDSLYEVQKRKDNNDSFKCRLDTWMETEYSENVLD